uniref:Uncharacterized protein MANES_07G046900 n=1 Tax=Rhizophora mucronata TaxID=61149 RepID=A0A2P2KG42_RHIMU
MLLRRWDNIVHLWLPVNFRTPHPLHVVPLTSLASNLSHCWGMINGSRGRGWGGSRSRSRDHVHLLLRLNRCSRYSHSSGVFGAGDLPVRPVSRRSSDSRRHAHRHSSGRKLFRQLLSVVIAGGITTPKILITLIPVHSLLLLFSDLQPLQLCLQTNLIGPDNPIITG